MTLSVGSLCSGYDGLYLGVAEVLDVAHAWTSEVDPSACAVLEARFPGVPNLGDLTTADWHDVEPVDVLIGGYPCFVAGTMVLTRTGYRPIETLKVGDRVLTHRGRWRAVTQVMRRSRVPVRRVTAGGVPGVVCSDEHPFYVRDQGRLWDNSRRSYARTFTEPRWCPAGELTRTSFVAKVLPPVEGDGRLPEFWWLVGRYLADGWRVRRQRTGSGKPALGDQGRVVICCAQYEADELEKRIAAAGFYGYRSKERTVTKFHIVDSDFFRFLKQFGSGAGGKLIPGWVLGLDQVRSDAMLAGYLSGDGHRTDGPPSGMWRVGTVSKALALGVALLAQRARGVVAGVREVKVATTRVIEGRTVNQRTRWEVEIPDVNRSAFMDGDTGWAKVKRNEPCGWAEVWNVAVANDESYVADGAVVHNCQPFSTAGRRRGADDERHLWPFIADAIGVLRPPLVLLENVGGHLSLGFDAVLADLARIGYDATWCLVRASDVGACHRRARLFVLAHPDGGRLKIGSELDGQPKPYPADGDPRRRHADRLGDAPADPDGTALGPYAGGGRTAAPTGASDGAERGSEPGPGERGGAPSDTAGAGWRPHQGGGPRALPRIEVDGRPAGESRRHDRGGQGGPVPADADGEGLQRRRGDHLAPGEGEAPALHWGAYGSAIGRHAAVLGRPAPNPVDGKGRLNEVFVEWMMMLPAGWVTDVVTSRAKALRILGNGVLPAQAAHALRWLLAQAPVTPIRRHSDDDVVR